MAAGLLTVGSVFVGTMEGCAAILAQGIEAPDAEAFCAGIARDYLSAKRPLPGFGHPFHKPDDPRTPRLFAVAEAAGAEGHYIRLLKMLRAAVDREAGRSEEHTSEIQSLMRISYTGFCLKKQHN